MEKAVDLRIEEILSGSEAVLVGRSVIRDIVVSSKQRKELGH